MHVISYYSSLYVSENVSKDNGLVEKLMPSLVTSSDNAMLTNLPSIEEVKEGVFAMNGSVFLGPNGFGGCFFKTFWDIVGPDVH